MEKFLVFCILAMVACVEGLQNPYCSLPCSFGGTRTILHTVCERDAYKCGPDPACGPDFKELPMTDNLRQYIVDLHNQLRDKVASGRETRDNQPRAKKMMVMNYDMELEFIAQCWANTCHGNPLRHDVCRGTKRFEHVGQNLGFINSTNQEFNIQQTVHSLIMYWYDEVALFKREWVPDTRDRGSKHKVGHYTQMLWADTDAVGCALTYYSTPNPNAAFKEEPKVVHSPYGDIIYLPAEINEKWHHLILACNYSPGGNYVGVPLYEEGKPCSGCPQELTCDEYSSLCGRTAPVNSTQSRSTPFFTF